MKKQPKKTAQTKQSIINAFWDIANKRGLDKVTISEVTKHAELNRGTFYSYFSDMEELLCHAEQTIIDDIRTKMESAIISDQIFDFRSVSSIIIEILGLYDDKFFMLLGKNGDPLFLDLLRKQASAVFNSVLDTQEQKPYQDYIIAYITSAFAGLLRFWHESGKKISIVELSGIAHGIVMRGVLGLKESSKN